MEAILGIIMDYMGEISAFIFGIGAIAIIIGKIKTILKELIELLQTVLQALNDGTLTSTEINKIGEEAMDIVQIFRKKKNA